MFSDLDCYHFGSTDAGLMTISGKLVKGVNIKDADSALMEEIKKLQVAGISVSELEKVKNKAESAMAFEDMSLMNRASSIAMYENLGDADLINTELSKYQSVTAEQISEGSKEIFDDNNCSTLYYLSNN
jgi:hypothetical protein